MEYVAGGTVCASKQEFVELLEKWISEPDRETVIGEPSTFGGKALIWIDVDGQRFQLNGDSRDAGVQTFLDLARRDGPEMPWHVVANTRNAVNKVAFGQPPKPIQYFYLYAVQSAAAPYTV